MEDIYYTGNEKQWLAIDKQADIGSNVTIHYYSDNSQNGNAGTGNNTGTNEGNTGTGNNTGTNEGNTGTGNNSGTNEGSTGTGNGSDTNSENNANLINKTQSAKAKIKSAKYVKSKKMKLKLSGLSDYDGYQIQYGLKKNFKGAKTITKKSNSVTIKKLKAQKKYYVRARVYKKIEGKTYYGKWSGTKKVTIKK